MVQTHNSGAHSLWKLLGCSSHSEADSNPIGHSHVSCGQKRNGVLWRTMATPLSSDPSWDPRRLERACEIRRELEPAGQDCVEGYTLNADIHTHAYMYYVYVYTQMHLLFAWCSSSNFLFSMCFWLKRSSPNMLRIQSSEVE